MTVRPPQTERAAGAELQQRVTAMHKSAALINEPPAELSTRAAESERTSTVAERLREQNRMNAARTAEQLRHGGVPGPTLQPLDRDRDQMRREARPSRQSGERIRDDDARERRQHGILVTAAYTPTTAQVREAYVRQLRNAFVASTAEHQAECDRWLASITAPTVQVALPDRDVLADVIADAFRTSGDLGMSPAADAVLHGLRSTQGAHSALRLT
ncbi:hypothetical protein [Curtobacterium sp. Leaf261]|uniref:hypothetical protein n=1 Tax=Curtobacterium sp. Leaf261 TaxID=1736311 RepID=UPI000AF65A33|nr:hypothetical protein [Curtobacterium sp. Leaf261]